MSDDEAQAPRTRLTRQTSSTEFRDFYRVNTDYSSTIGGNTLSVVCEDIVIVYKDITQPENCSDLLYVIKRDDTKNRGWINPTFIDKTDRIHQFSATGAVFSNPPVAAGIGSLSSVSSMSSSMGSTSTTKRLYEDLTVNNCNVSDALSNTHNTVGGSFSVASSNTHNTAGGRGKKIRKKKVFKPPPPQQKSKGNTVHRTNNYNPTEIIWMVNTKFGTVRDFDRIMHHFPVAYNLIEYLIGVRRTGERKCVFENY